MLKRFEVGFIFYTMDDKNKIKIKRNNTVLGVVFHVFLMFKMICNNNKVLEHFMGPLKLFLYRYVATYVLRLLNHMKKTYIPISCTLTETIFPIKTNPIPSNTIVLFFNS